MKKLLAAALLAGGCTLGASPALADAIEEKNLLKGKDAITADQGYIYLHAPHRYAGIFIKVPGEADYEQYRADYEEAYAKAREKYEKRLASYERRMEKWTPKMRHKPQKPDEVSRETFSIGAIELRGARSFGPMYVYDKRKDEDDGGKGFGYLTSVEPGTYIWYGTVVFDPNQGWLGECLCMGSVQFEVKPGVITNLGDSLLALPDFANHPTAPAMDIVVSGAFSGTKIKLPEGGQAPDFSLPDSLLQYDVEQAELRASGKMNNFYGVMVSRLAPIDGVLAYERDTVVDVQSGNRLQAAVAPE